MKRTALLVALSLFLVVTPVLAKKGEVKNNPKKTEISIEQVCDPADFWKNHGQYVSCVAKLYQGGAPVSAAAKAEIGKKPKASPTPEVSPSTSPSPSESPSSTSSASPTASPSVTPGPVGGPGDLNVLNASRVEIEIKALVEVLKSIIVSLQNLMTN